MRVIYQTAPTPMTFQDPRPNGRVIDGYAHLEVEFYGPAEPEAPVPGHPGRVRSRTVKDWREQAGVGQPVIAVPTRSFAGWIPPTIIPESVLAPLQRDAKLVFNFVFVPARSSR
jgi:hypothetical protein